MNKQVDVSQYSEDELIELNGRIVERLTSLRQHRRFAEMTRFNIGDTVSFTADAGRMVVGKVARANTKTITVISSGGERWRVSPGFLSHTTEGELGGSGGQTSPTQAKVLSLVGQGGESLRRP